MLIRILGILIRVSWLLFRFFCDLFRDGLCDELSCRECGRTVVEGRDVQVFVLRPKPVVHWKQTIWGDTNLSPQPVIGLLLASSDACHLLLQWQAMPAFRMHGHEEISE